MISSKILPEGYKKGQEIDLQKDLGLLLKLNVWGLLSLPGIGIVLLWLGAMLNPGIRSPIKILAPQLPIGGLIAGLLLGVVITTILHELIHGISFWLLTHQPPVFGFRATYAFAAAPDWYLPRNRYFWVGAAPLVIISAVGIAGIPLIPARYLFIWLFCVLTNASGAVGDIYVLAQLARLPSHALVQDRGDAIAFYLEVAN